MALATYLALGDSMSIDRYPGLDEAEIRGRSLPRPGLGAASLLARNDDATWPEFARRDLATASPGLRFLTRAEDGATTESVLEGQMEALDELGPGRESLVTLTAGGNDLLGLLGTSERGGGSGVRAALERLAEIVRRVRRAAPSALLLVANVYDPTDGSGDLGGTRLRAVERRWLDDFNAGVARVCAGGEARLVDLHAHFLGHGASAPVRERWYWRRSLIEPGLAGASEIRRLWLRAAGLGPR